MKESFAEAAAARAAITVRELHYSNRRGPLIVGFKWELLEGTVAALLGLTGSGKSTLLQLLAGIMKGDQGEVRILGYDPAKSATRKLIGYMPQTAGLYVDLSVEDNMRVFSIGHGVRGPAAAELDKMLDLVSLARRRKDLVRDLSVGQQQRVSLAVALLDAPAVLLLDEPFAHADAEFQRRLWAHFHELGKQQRTVLVATAHPHVAAQAAHVGILRGGRLAANGAMDALAPPGRAKVVMRYQERTGPRTQELVLEDYRTELSGVMANSPGKPGEVIVTEETAERRLEQMLSEDGHA